MTRLLFAAVISVLLFPSCSRHSYYIVRHAEKASAGPNMSSDVPLTDDGKRRAEAIRTVLSDRRIAMVYSTNTIRTKSTAQPTADHFNLSVQTYGPFPDTSFINLLRSNKKNTLIVGHSNTIDDVANMLMGTKVVPGDLPDSEYNKLFIVTFKGKKATFKESLIFGTK